jgi:hypothetical protein
MANLARLLKLLDPDIRVTNLRTQLPIARPVCAGHAGSAVFRLFAVAVHRGHAPLQFFLAGNSPSSHFQPLRIAV